MRLRLDPSISRRLLCVGVLLLLSLMFSPPIQSHAYNQINDLTNVKVAIYNGNGPMLSSRIALTRMFQWMNATVVNVTASQILNGFLDDCDIVVFPGGSETSYNAELESEGRQKIQDFVGNGGSYFGICGGATFGVSYLHLFNGFITPVNELGSTIHATTMNLNRSSMGPNLSDFPSNFTTMYYASQYFVPKWGVSFHPIARYDYNDQPGMIAFKYKNGTTFLSSPHPEYEENGDRDGTAFGEYLNDTDSEWPLLLQVSRWLIDESPFTPAVTTATSTALTNSTTTTVNTNSSTTSGGSLFTFGMPLIIVASTGGVLIVLVALILFRRTHG